MGNGTSLGRVRGLGSAHEGAHHWLVQRFTAVGNIVLVVWLVGSIVLLPDLSYATASAYFAKPVPATAMALLIVSTFWHARLGLQVLVEDYVHDEGTKWGVLALVNMAALAGMVTGLYFLIRVVTFAISQEATAAMLAQAMGGAL